MGAVPREIIEQYICECVGCPWPLIMVDGGAVFFMKTRATSLIAKSVSVLNEGEIQIFGKGEEWEIIVKIPWRDNFRPGWKDVLWGGLRKDKMLASLDQFVNEAAETVEKMGLEPIRFKQSMLSDIIEMDFSKDVPKATGTLKTNVSVVQTGENHFSQVLKVANIDMLPVHFNEVADEAVKVITVIKPGKEEQKNIKKAAMNRMEIMQSIAPELRTEVRVHTIMGDDDISLLMTDQIYYMDLGLVIKTETTLDELNEKEKKIREKLRGKKISIYTPTNGQREEFIAMLPGMGRYSNTLQIARKAFVEQAVFRMFSL